MGHFQKLEELKMLSSINNEILKFNQCKMCLASTTEIIKVCIDAIWSSHGADETGFQEGAPSIHQHSLASLVILRDEGRYRL